MSEIISMLCTQEDYRQSFVVNKTLKEVNIEPIVTPSLLFGSNPDSLNNYGLRVFQPGESIRVLSVAVCLPYGFQKSTNPFYIEFLARNNVGVVIPTSLTDSDFIIPYENAEINFDVFLSNPTGIQGFSLCARIRNYSDDSTKSYSWGKISMVNCPSVFADNDIMYSQVFVKVLHNLPLTA